MDTLSSCRGCGGAVVNEAETCPMCVGTGAGRYFRYGVILVVLVIAVCELLSIF